MASQERQQPIRRIDLNAGAIQTTVDALIERGALDPEADAARIALAVGLAVAVDADNLNASLWREYRAAEAALYEERGGSSDAAQAVIDAMRAPMGDAKNTRAPHTRRASSRGG